MVVVNSDFIKQFQFFLMKFLNLKKMEEEQWNFKNMQGLKVKLNRFFIGHLNQRQSPLSTACLLDLLQRLNIEIKLTSLTEKPQSTIFVNVVLKLLMSNTIQLDYYSWKLEQRYNICIIYIIYQFNGDEQGPKGSLFSTTESQL